MNCKESRLRISDIVWQGQSPQDDIELFNHINTCVKCRSFYENYTIGVKAINSGKRVTPDNSLFDSVMSQLSSHEPNSKSIHTIRPVIKLAYSTIVGAAAIFIGILIGNAYLGGKATVEKETYSKEIASLNSDMSTLNAKIIEYYESENAE